MTSQHDRPLPELIAPIYGIALSDEVAVDLVTGCKPQVLAAMRNILSKTLANLIYIGGQRFILGSPNQRLDPLFTAQWLLTRFSDAAALISTSPEVEHPFNYARRTLALDDFTNGRLGVVVGPQDLGSGLASNKKLAQSDTPSGAELAIDFACVLRKLWNSWPEASIISDKKRGVFADSSQIVAVNHNKHYKIRGPLNAPSSVQGEPVLGWHLSAPQRPNEYAQDAELYISPRTLKAFNTPPNTVHLVLRQLSDLSATDTPGIQQGAGTLLFLNNESAILEATAKLEILDARQTSEFVTPKQGTLRERLGLAKRTLDVSEYTSAFATPELIGDVK